jgi:hypothetical protein
MADTKISALGAATTLAGTEVLPVVQSGSTVKATITQIMTRAATVYGLVKNNITTINPGASDDSGAGWAAGSNWFNTATGGLWICRSASAGAAVWERLDIADHPGYVSGNWYPSLSSATFLAGGAVGANTLRGYPALIKEKLTLADLGIRVTTGAAGNAQVGIYAMNPTTKMPTGNALAYTGNMDTTSATLVAGGGFAGGTLVSGGTVPLEPGWYYLFCNFSAAPALQTVTNTNSSFSAVLGSPTQNDISSAATLSNIYLSVASTSFGSWPDLTSASFNRNVNAAFAHVQFKIA